MFLKKIYRKTKISHLIIMQYYIFKRKEKFAVTGVEVLSQGVPNMVQYFFSEKCSGPALIELETTNLGSSLEFLYTHLT